MKLKLLFMSFIFSTAAICGPVWAAEPETADPDILFYENFEHYLAGTPLGWSIEDPNSVTPYISKDEQGNCAKIISTAALYDAALKKYFPSPISSGSIYVHMKIQTPDVVFKRSMFAFRDTANRECMTVMFDADGYIKTASGVKLVMYRTNRWYDFLVKFDMDSKTHSIWIDGERVVTDLKLANAEVSNIYYLKFSQLERQNAYCFLDDLYAYRSDSIVPEKTIKDAYFFGYSDIEESWARTEIENFAAKHITTKTGDGKFHPEGQVSKGEFTLWFQHSMGIPEMNYVGMCSDVAAEDEIAGSIMALVEAGANGPYFGEWMPDAEVTLGDALKMVIEGYKYQKKMLPGEPEKTFSSLQEKGAWARDYEAQADAIGLCQQVKGLDRAAGNSDRVLTRAQAVKLLANYQKIIE